MLEHIKPKKLTKTSLLAVLMTGSLLSSSSFGSLDSTDDSTTNVNATGSITPSTYTNTIGLSQTVSLEREITVSIPDIVTTETTTTTTPAKLDILFLADNTGSMGDEIGNVQTNANSLLNSLSSKYSDLQVGVARYYGDPTEYGSAGNTYTASVPTGETVTYTRTYTYDDYYFSSRGIRFRYNVRTIGSDGSIENDTKSYSSYKGGSFTKSWEQNVYTSITEPIEKKSYELQESVNGGSLQDSIDAINNWFASGGGDWPEGNFFALQQAATSGTATNSGYATEYNTGWRTDAEKVIVWFGDARSHTSAIDQAETIQALTDNNVTVIAIYASDSPNSYWGLDGSSQASNVASQTDGQYAAAYSSQLASTIENLIDDTVVETTTSNTFSPKIDLSFSSTGNTSGLTITYTCIDNQGCNDVGNGETRRFKMDVIGETAGTYNFNTVVNNVTGATATNNITVVNFAD